MNSTRHHRFIEILEQEIPLEFRVDWEIITSTAMFLQVRALVPAETIIGVEGRGTKCINHLYLVQVPVCPPSSS